MQTAQQVEVVYISTGHAAYKCTLLPGHHPRTIASVTKTHTFLDGNDQDAPQPGELFDPQINPKVERFTGVVENTIPHKDIGWVRTDAGETLFFHKNYTRAHKLPSIGQRVKGRIGRVENEDKQARAFNVEVCNG